MDEFDFERFYIKLTKRNLIKKSEKIDIYTVLDEEADTIRILKICKGRDLSTVCKTLKEVKDSNVAIVYDYVYYNGDTYILEEKLQGETLGEKLEVQGTLSPEETVRIITKVCDGLSVLHNMEPPVIHRDKKPSNKIICDDRNVKVFDFD
ncbi:MAG: protein kinase, partial [Clostridia bacterium]|nr:protein kinase [Clostridia bacterium]